MEGMYVVGATADKNQAKVTIVKVPDRPGIASKIFSSIAKAHVNVDMIVQNVSHRGYTDVSFTTTRSELHKTLKIVKAVARQIKAEDVLSNSDVAKVSIVGAGMTTHPGVASRMFTALARAKINIDMISTSEIKVSCIVKHDQADRAVKVLHKEFLG
jgi:aspartate kinase